ncbi:MAG: FISUMP domain-containing protein [Bacteroidota bacterium]
MKCRTFFWTITCLITLLRTSDGQTPPPGVSDVYACANVSIPPLTATGVDIKWYSSDASPSSTLYDSRNGQTYQTVTIENQVWMAENLNYGTMINGSANPSNNATVEKYCYDNYDFNCETNGGLYKWNEMMGYSNSPGIQGICPSGWHLPTHDQWKQLEIALGMSLTQVDQTSMWRGTDQGTQLKVSGGSGFEAKMAGKRTPEGTFGSVDAYTTFWTSTYPYNRTLSTSSSGIWLSNSDDENNGFSVRCVMDPEAAIYSGNTYATGQTAAGTYTYYVTQTVGGVESARVPVRLIIRPTPTVTITGASQACDGNDVELDAGAGYSTYRWNDNSTGRTAVVNETGIYSVTVTDANGCEAGDQHTVTFLSSLNVNISGDTAACEGELVNLDAGAGYSSYSWGNGSTSQSISVGSSGTYTVTIRDASQCEGTGQVQVIFHPLPSVTITGESEGCEGDAVLLNAGAGYVNYKWDTNEITSTIQVYSSGTYSVTVSDIHGCEGSDDFPVTFIECGSNHTPEIQGLTINIMENQIKGSVIGKLHATDIDVGQVLSYSIVSGNEGSPFSVDPWEGQLKVNAPQFIDHETNPQFIITIKVQDNGIGLLSDTAIIIINVLDVNERPQIDARPFTIAENAWKDTWVGTIEARDEDVGQTLTFSLESGNVSNAFSLDPNTGRLTVNNHGAIDYEAITRFDLGIRVTDNGIPPLDQLAIIPVHISDITGISKGDKDLKDIRMYPNPTGGDLCIETDRTHGGEISILVFDSRGAVRTHLTLTSSDLAPGAPVRLWFSTKGVYFVKVVTDRYMKVEKVICY